MRLAVALALACACGIAPAAETPPPGRLKSQPCAPCHGAQGISIAPDAPNLAGQPQIYLAAQLKAFRSGQRVHPVMNVIARPLSDTDIAELSAWYSAIAVEARRGP